MTAEERKRKLAILSARHKADREAEGIAGVKFVDIGVLQRELEAANSELKKTRKALEAAKKNFQEAQKTQSSLNIRFIEMAESISGAANTA